MPASHLMQTHTQLKAASTSFKAVGHTPATSYCTAKHVSIPGDDHSCTDDFATQHNLQDLSRSGDNEAAFSLAQFYFSRGYHSEAINELQRISLTDRRACYQLAVMRYDGIGTGVDYAESIKMMTELANNGDPGGRDPVQSCALYNLGRAHYEGFGCQQSDEEAERLWLLAAKEGEQGGCVQAMTVLGMFYSRIGERAFDLAKAHYWHQEATGNGSIESQGALGVMYECGLGVERDQKASFFCYKHAAEGGNLFAMGHLTKRYYISHLYNHCLALAEKLASIEDVKDLAKQTGCLEEYAKKGVALGCFIYARCFEKGIVVEKNREMAAKMYSRASRYDIDTVAQLHDLLVCGEI